ncbi:HlyD family type I secretion periplasmic adaptor subunit [Variovorax sp. OV700]|uniref:HlyD family type I secretion periplasmic adaptor subunit n=1 Tax=Variovorax sp. OV700 TaxID=1882826 RepID=UPI000887FF77|nr:HlyD family type I secretion periplasmic adaptor subunit [Variovorax sp. OV700]SDJ80614.1 HlyD family secretion protein [Variovorax sp. OV700]
MKFHADALEFAPGLLSIQDSPPPALPRAVLYTVVSLCGLMLLWATLGKLDVVASADGKLVPQSYVKIVQPAEAGIVSDILVKEGDLVQAGQTLIRLDSTLSAADGQSLASELAVKRLALRRIDAELAGRSLRAITGDHAALLAQVQLQSDSRSQAYRDALAQEAAVRERTAQDLKAAQETLNKLKVTLPSYQQSAEAHRKLVNEGFLSQMAGNEKEREAVEKAQDLKAQIATVDGLTAGILAQDKKIAALTSNYRSQLLTERTEIMASLLKLEQEEKKFGFKTNLTELKAPQTGVVKDLATTTRGAVVQPGLVLLTLVPKGEALVAEVQIKNEDIGFIHKGQEVKLKLAAYPFQKYGLLDGQVQSVAPDATPSANDTAQTGARTAESVGGYRALIKLTTQYLEAADRSQTQHYTLDAGMHVSAEIHQGERTVIEYLLSPVSRTLQEAARER